MSSGKLEIELSHVKAAGRGSVGMWVCVPDREGAASRLWVAPDGRLDPSQLEDLLAVVVEMVGNWYVTTVQAQGELPLG